MFYKNIPQFPRSFSYRKNKVVSLKSLNLYSKNSETTKENKSINYRINYSKNGNYNIIKSMKQKSDKKNIKEKYLKLLKKDLSSQNDFIKERYPQNIGEIKKNDTEKGYLFKLKIKTKNSNEIKKSNSCLNIKDFSTLHSSFYLNKGSTSFSSSKRKLLISSYNKKESPISNCSNISKKNKNFQKSFVRNIMYEKRKKYPFIYNSDIIKIQKFEDLPESLTNINKKYFMILNQENMSLFNHTFNIINKGKFSQKFETPGYYLGKYHIINKRKESQNENEIVHGKKIIKDLDKIIKLNENKYRTKKEIIFYKFRKKLKELLIVFKNLMIPLKEIITTYKITNHIFNYEKTNDLVFAIKLNNYDLAFKILTNYKYLVLDVDQFYQTPLHYAARYNFYKIIPLILGYGGYIDSKNSYGETPLMISLKRNYYESILLLFLHLSSPLMNVEDKKKLGDIKNFTTNYIFEKIKDIYVKLLLVTSKNFYVNVKNAIYAFIINECRGYIETDCFDFIQNKINFYKFDK